MTARKPKETSAPLVIAVPDGEGTRDVTIDPKFAPLLDAFCAAPNVQQGANVLGANGRWVRGILRGMGTYVSKDRSAYTDEIKRQHFALLTERLASRK